MMRNTRLRAVALLGAAALVFTACGDDADPAEPADTGTDGATSTEATSSGVLEGVRGTLPSVELGQDFQDRLLEVDGDLQDFSYSAETYDAVVIMALAAEVAGTDDALAVATEIPGVTTEGTKCTTFEECKQLIADGEDIDYDGVGGPYEFSGAGEPTAASFAIQQYGPDNRIDPALTEYAEAAIDSPPTEFETPAASGGTSDGVFKIGTILPVTGDLAFLGPPEIAGSELAKQEINDAGGVLGNDLEILQGDSGDTNTDIANQTVDDHLAAGVDAILGAASSGVSFTVIDKITAANVIHFSPANTSPDFTDYDDNGLYFRTAPSDVLQGRVLADQILAEGQSNVVIFARQEPYGEGLLRFTTEPLEAAGATVTQIVYDPAATEFTAEVQQAVEANPEAIVLISFDEVEQLGKSLIEQGLGPQDVSWWFVDGNIGNATGEFFDN